VTTFNGIIRSHANVANTRLADALNAQMKADKEVTAALIEQREVMAALRAVSTDPDEYESTRGATLESRCEGRAFRE
jgi:hypothetical protein